MQMANTRRATYEAAETGGNGAKAGGSGENNVNHNEPHPEPHLPPPPPLTVEVLYSFLEVSATPSNLRRTWKIFCVPLPTMFNVVTTKVVAMG
jgi:hypothetical protein